MNKVYGTSEDFALVKQDASRIIFGYGKKSVDETHFEWYEVYLYKKNRNKPSFAELKDAIIEDINSRTDEKILTGFVWNDIPCWLSTESQFNFKAAYDLAEQKNGATLPVRFKLGETVDENGNKTPAYYTFEDFETLDDFFTKSVVFINQCLNEGWAEKDGVDFTPYEEALNNLTLDE